MASKVGPDPEPDAAEEAQMEMKVVQLPKNISYDISFSLCGKTKTFKLTSEREAGNSSAPQIHLSGLNLKYSLNGNPLPGAQDAFHSEYAEQSLYWFRWANFLVGGFMTVYAYYDYYYYGTYGTQYTMATMARFCGIVPSLLLAGTFAMTKYYKRHKTRDFVIMSLSLGLGAGIMCYNLALKTGSYATFSIYFATLYTLAPLPFLESSVLGILMWSLYLPVLWYAGDKIFTLSLMYEMATLLVSLVLYMYFRFEYLRYLAVDIIQHSFLHRDKNDTKKAQELSKNILLSMVPPSLVSHLETGSNKKYAKVHPEVTVLFAEICHFATIAQKLDGPADAVVLLNTVFTAFDTLIDVHRGMYKVETVGEVYLAVAGAPDETTNHYEIAACMALGMIRLKATIKAQVEQMYGAEVAEMVDLHIGLNSGKVVAGVCGKKSKRYKLFGDTVNTASRMESTCPPGRIQVSEGTAQLLSKGTIGIKLTERGKVKVKGKGDMTTSLLDEDQGKSFFGELVAEPMYIAKDKVNFDSPGKLAQKRSSVLQATKSLTIMDMIEEDIGDNEHAHERDLTYMAIWGAPYGPCASKAKKDHPDLNRYYSKVEEKYTKAHLKQYMQSFLQFAIITMVGGAAFIYQDVGRKENYIAFCTNAHSSRLDCEGSVSSLCRWDSEGNMCRRDVNVTRASDCEWHFDAEFDPELRDRVLTQWQHAITARFYVMMPLCLCVLLLTRVKWFNSPENVWKLPQQFLVFMLMLNIGCSLIATTWVGGDPGTGMIICWMFLAMNVSYFRYLWRILTMIAICILYCLAIYINNPYKTAKAFCEEPYRYIGTRFQYIFFSIICLALPLMTRETYKRRSFLRRIAIKNTHTKLVKAKEKTTELLETFLPKLIVRRLEVRTEGEEIADRFDSASVLFTDMKGFTAYSSQVQPEDLVEFLNVMYNKFDEITDLSVMYKVEIIGDAYFCVSGCPRKDPDHAARACYSALKMLDAIEDMKNEDAKLKEAGVQIRIGVHTGDVVAGVVGVKDPRYHLFGATVKLANNMESHGIPSRVHVSKETHDSLMDAGSYGADSPFAEVQFATESRGVIPVEDFGERETFLINGYDGTIKWERDEKKIS
jgi:class 3 adenylate cyclase